MRALVVYCHPIPDSFCAALRDAAVRGLRSAGHEVSIIDLYGEKFEPVMRREEWARYVKLGGEIPDGLGAHVDLVKSSQILVFVYPSWWGGLPAMLKGWFERVLLPGIAFRLNDKGRIVPAMHHVRKVYMISTFGSPRSYVKFVNDNGRRIISRALRTTTRLRTRYSALTLYAMDKQNDRDRAAFVARVERKLARS